MIRRQIKNLRQQFKRERKAAVQGSKQVNNLKKLHPELFKFVVDSVKGVYPELFERR